MAGKTKHILAQDQKAELLTLLKKRFEKHPARHPNISWENVLKSIENKEQLLWTVNAMEQSGGEPDVVQLDPNDPSLYFIDCVAESPKERRSLCYDEEAWLSRKEHKPKCSAQAMAEEMGAKLLDEFQYNALQKLGEFDLKTSSWLATPNEVRSKGGAIFGDRRFGRVFVYHNGAESYYAGRAFRCFVVI